MTDRLSADKARISAALPRVLISEIERIAKKEKRSKSQMIELLLEAEVQRIKIIESEAELDRHDNEFQAALDKFTSGDASSMEEAKRQVRMERREVAEDAPDYNKPNTPEGRPA